MPFATLAFAHDGTVEDQPRSVTVTHAEFHHEMVSFEVPAFSVDSKRYQTGVPVMLTWGSLPTASATFIGYVNHTKPVYDVAERNEPVWRQVVCVGPSFLMKNGGYAGHKNLSATAVLRAMAKEFRFDPANIQASARTFASLSQSGRSYWEFAVELANKVGFTFYMLGTSVYFHERLAAVSKFKGTIPTFSPRGGGLVRFQALVGATAPDGGELADRHLYGMNAETGRPLLGQQRATKIRPLLGAAALSAVLQRGDASPSVTSLSEAQDVLSAKARANQLPVMARIETMGNPRLRVGGLVHLMNLDRVNNGVWYVTKVKHEIRAQQFTTVAEIGRDALSSALTLPTQSTAAPGRPSRLTNMQWVAA